MPDPTSTAEILRDQPPKPEPEPRTPFENISAKIDTTYEGLLTSRREQEKGLERKAAAVEPRLTEAQQALETMGREGKERLGRVEVAKPEIAAPPSRRLTEFLSPREGESPEASVLKMIHGLGLLAGSVGGMARGDARGALAAMKGALAGWHDGDAERADRAFADWKAKTESALKQWETERTGYQDWFSNANLSFQQMMKGAELEAIRHDNQGAAQAFRSGSYEIGLKFLQDTRNHEDQVQAHRDRLLAMHDEKERDREYKLELARLVAAQKQSKIDDVLAQYTPEVLAPLGQAWALTGKVPGGLGYGAAGQAVRAKVVQAGIEWAKGQGIDLQSLPAVQAEVASARAALTKLRGVNAVQMTAIRRFDGHADALIRLSEKVDRTGSPVINRYVLKSRGEYAGDKDVATFEVQAFELAMEFARVVVGTAQGDAMTRDEARKNISAALNKEQLVAVVEQLRQNAHRNIESNKTSEQALTDIVTTAGGYIKPKEMPAAPALPNDPLRIRR